MFQKNKFQYTELKNAYKEIKNKFNIVFNGLGKK
jgi:hypothetical protein